jgi:anti-anti-sigma factor
LALESQGVSAGDLLELTVEELMTTSSRPSEKVLAAPEELGLDSRTAFRRAAGELLEQLAEGSGRLVIDLSSTRQIDSAGLGALMLIQRKAAERRLAVCLRGANEELRFLLVLTKLDDLFELERGAS